MKYALLLLIITSVLAISACSNSDDHLQKMTDEDRASLGIDSNSDNSSPANQEAPTSTKTAPPSGQLGISPMSPMANSFMKLSAPSGVDLSEANIIWHLNGAPLSGFSSSTLNLAEAEITKHDNLYATVNIQGAELRSPEVTVNNSPPNILSLKIMPETFKPGDTMYLDVQTEDADNDPVTLTYAWTINDADAGNTRELSSSIKSGDKLMCRVSTFDGEDYGQEKIINFSLANQPPMIVEHYKYSFDGTTYTYQTKASDPDNDPLTFALKSAPDGMSIDSITGEVTWQVPSDFVGTATYVITADDGNGGSSEMEQSFRITQE